MIATVLLGTMLAMGPPIPVGPGITCAPWAPPGAPKNHKPTPVSYRASDLGKPGVPILDANSRRVLLRIERTHRSRTLRFAYLFWSWSPSHRERFIVYDATRGPCAEGARYRVLNGPETMVYQPSEDPWGTESMPGPGV